MDLSFAVLLMRSSYNSVDELDCVPMNEFQKQFFLFRQTEWEDYHNKHPNVLQADLADPSYFDFISFAQYATISAQLRQPRQSFVELVSTIFSKPTKHYLHDTIRCGGYYLIPCME